MKDIETDIDEIVLNRAIQYGILQDGSTTKDLTTEVQDPVCDTYVLDVAIRMKFLANNATLADLTPTAKAAMQSYTCLGVYHPDGTVNDEATRLLYKN